MLHFSKFKYFEPKIEGKRKIYDNNIYTFDIETSSYLVLNGKQLNTLDYESLSDKDKEACVKRSCMYIWMFGINDIVYYGRTWDELKIFLNYINENINITKYLFIHNLSFEFQFLKSEFNITDVLARKAHKPITALLEDYNFILKCSYMSSNSSLENLPKIFNLDVEKKVGDLDYHKIRHNNTPLTEKEMGYCEYDCLVLYKYVLKELETYKTVKNIPSTNTGKVRRELKELTLTDFKYKKYVKQSINTDPHIYNLLVETFAGGYTHANRLFAGDIIDNVDSYDETSAYPFCMVTSKFPGTEFKRCYLKRIEDMSNRFAYLVVVKFTNIRCKYYNSFISMSKCRNIKGALYDNGRIIKADEIIISLTDIDFKFIYDTHYIDSYEIIESYYSLYKYLPKKLINFILDKYVAKTELKNVEGKEDEYQRIKGMFNSIYGMSVTNNIRDDVIFDNDKKEWSEVEIDNEKIIELLSSEKKKSFLSFSYGVWVTAHARNNLLRRVIELDEYVIYCDTDSIKLRPGYDKNVFINYNKSVEEKIKYVSNLLNIDYNRYAPFDIKGNSHLLGIFEHEGLIYNKYTYKKFITQGAKKYAYIEQEKNEEDIIEDKIHITVSGVPKKAKVGLKKLEDFKDDYVFKYKDTNKHTLFYVENQSPFELEDYLGNKHNVSDKSGVCLVPTTYVLGKSIDYTNLISDDSSRRAIYKEG